MNIEGPGIRRAFFFRIYSMLRVKTIGLLAAMGVFWALTQQLACVKNNGGLLASPPGVFSFKGQDSLSYLALGDSYTIGESVADSDRYPARVVSNLQKNSIPYKAPRIIATTGWTTTDLLAAIPTATTPPYHAVSLLIGVNDQYQQLGVSEYRTRFSSLVQQSIRLTGGKPSHVIILSIPDYSVTPFARGSDKAYIAAQIDSFNMINKELAVASGVQYLDVTGESRKAANDPSLIAGDGLHFSGKEYAIWATMIVPLMRSIH